MGRAADGSRPAGRPGAAEGLVVAAAFGSVGALAGIGLGTVVRWLLR